MALEVVLRAPDVDDYLALRQSVGWQVPGREVAEVALANSVAAAFARCGGEILGTARVVGDGALHWYVQDVIVRPEWQRRGIGRAMLEALERHVQPLMPGGTSLGLVTDPEALGFYRALGYAVDGEYVSRALR